jgi:NAD(P)-dependent dehydrogenase (short-subunit alcohol dehydrogenase family)
MHFNEKQLMLMLHMNRIERNKNMKDGRVCLVFGCGKGNVGEGVAQEFSDNGYYVIGTDINADKDSLVADEFYSCDVTDEKSVKKLFDRIKHVDNIDVIVNSAGVNILGPIDDYSTEEFDLSIAVNTRSHYYIIREYVKRYDNNKCSKTYLGITSDTGSFLAKTSSFAYAASKAGANALLQSMARELDKYHTDEWNVLAFAAGMIESTPMDERTVKDVAEQRGITNEEVRKMLTANIPKKRGLSIGEVSKWVYFLTHNGVYASGNVIRVDNFQQQG